MEDQSSPRLLNMSEFGLAIQYNSTQELNNSLTNSTEHLTGLHDQRFDAFIYIVAVLLFYSASIVLLMIKYVRREEHEAELDFYYLEFVKREHLPTNAFLIDKRTSPMAKYLLPIPEKEQEENELNQTSLTINESVN